MKKLIVMNLLIMSRMLCANPVNLIERIGDNLICIDSIDTNGIERFTHASFDLLIYDADRKDQNYLLARATINDNQFEYYDGENFQKQKNKEKTPMGNNIQSIEYFLLSRYEKQSQFHFFCSEKDPSLKKFLQRNESKEFNDLLNTGQELMEREERTLAAEFFIRGWQNGSYSEKWRVYQELEKIMFPKASQGNFSTICRKIYMGYYFLKDIIAE